MSKYYYLFNKTILNKLIKGLVQFSINVFLHFTLCQWQIYPSLDLQQPKKGERGYILIKYKELQ